MAGCCSEKLRRTEQLNSSTNSVKIYITLSAIPNGGDSYRLELNGKSYHNVYSGLYLEIPEKHLICFRTEPNIGADYFHVVPTKSDFEEFKIKLDKENDFGHTLGVDKAAVGSTYVEKVEGDDIYFIERNSFRHEQHRYQLNLKLHTLKQLN
jgi:hypothetical protein